MSGFIIPRGTQVVLKGSKRVPGTKEAKPAGSVAEVVEAPTSNRSAYLVRFADGIALRVKFAELSIRRREVDEHLAASPVSLTTPGENLRPFIIYSAAVGSRAFGLATADSDEDIRGIYLPPAAMTWSLQKPPEQWESVSDGRDEVYWELEKFLVLALKANPNVLETLWSPIVLVVRALGSELRAMRTAFLSKHIYKTYSGYVLSQFRRTRNHFQKTGAFKTKHAMHLVRLLLSGLHALDTGEIRVDVHEHREELLSIKAGRLSFDQIHARALQLDREFQAAYTRTRLPERPDYERANAFLLRARRSQVDA